MSRQERREGLRSSGIALAVLAAIAVIGWLSSLVAGALGWPWLAPVFAALIGTAAGIGAGLYQSGREGKR